MQNLKVCFLAYITACPPKALLKIALGADCWDFLLTTLALQEK